jgi:hypothetical protein
MKEMNSLLWNSADLSWGGHSSIWPLELWYLAIRHLFIENSFFFFNLTPRSISIFNFIFNCVLFKKKLERYRLIS